MATITDRVSDIADYGAIAARRAGENSNLIQKLGTSLCVRIEGMKNFTAAAAVELHTSIEQSKLPDEIKLSVQAALDARATAMTDEVALRAGQQEHVHIEQHLKHAWNYFTGNDYAAFENPRSSPWVVKKTLVHRLHRLGIKSPGHDSLLKWALVVVIHCRHEATDVWPSYQDIYAMFRDIVESMKVGVVSFPFPLISFYPEYPEQLPADIFKFAYDEDDGPLRRWIPKYEYIGKHIPLRSNSRLLQSSPKSCGKRDWDYMSTCSLTMEMRLGIYEYVQL